jgi:hypothetical protein
MSSSGDGGRVRSAVMSIDRDEHVVAAYVTGEDLTQIEQRFGISADNVRRIVATATSNSAQDWNAHEGHRSLRLGLP